MVGMVITKRVSVTCIISIPAPLFKRGGHFVARFLHFCCRWRKNGLQGVDLLEVEPLVCRVRGMVLRVVFCALFTVRPES